jgi:acetyltransferase-like isoleucine patch superfamily enzyme
MFPEQEAKGLLAKVGLYFEARHGDLAGGVADAMTAAGAWAPGLPGLFLRSLWDRLWIKGGGWFARERGVRILGAKFITIDGGAFLDYDVYLHGRPGGLSIGPRTRVMAGAVLHVYNHRDLAGSGIRIGADCVIGIGCVITGQGGVMIEDQVILAPKVMVLPVGHVHDDPGTPIREQGLTARGVMIKRGAWIGAGAIILDGVTVGENAVVGAGAVVTSDVPGHAVVVGNPARPVKTIPTERASS